MSKTLAGRGTPVLYLDFDGVLHPEDVRRTRRRGPTLSGYPGHRLFENLEPLAQALAFKPEVSIVLSTSWVIYYRYSRTRQLLGPLASRVIGATFHTQMNVDTFNHMSRGQQVEADVYRRQPSSWLALDDDAQDWPDWSRDNLVHTHDQYGVCYSPVWENFIAKLSSLT